MYAAAKNEFKRELTAALADANAWAQNDDEARQIVCKLLNPELKLSVFLGALHVRPKGVVKLIIMTVDPMELRETYKRCEASCSDPLEALRALWKLLMDRGGREIKSHQ